MHTAIATLVIRDIGREVDAASFFTASAAAFERLGEVGRASIAHWTTHFKALAKLHRINRRKSKGWRRHIRRVKAGR